jgi:hypothetical protein
VCVRGRTRKSPAGTDQVPRLRIEKLGTGLRAALIAVLAEVGGPILRPVTLSKALKLDDSLAARLLRSVRAGDALSTLRELPAPQGLGLFLDAAAKKGVSTAVRKPAELAVKELEELLAEMPLGRASLDTAIDGWLPSGRAKAERAGKQAVFKALSQTLGFTVDTACFAAAIQPSRAGDCCDTMTMLAMDGIRRLREGAPILLFGHTQNPARPDQIGRDGLPMQIAETLDGEREFADARKLLMADVGGGRELPVRLIERGGHTRVVLESSTPPLNVPVTVAVASVVRNAYHRYGTDGRKTECFTNACKVPIRVFVQDLFLHEDVYPSFVPEIVARMDSLSCDPSVRDEELLEVDRLDLDVELVRQGWGLDRVGIKEWGGYGSALRSAFRRAGWDPAKFRAYRCYVRYPLPFVSLTTWFDLPPGP